jgi:hypothetical protein
VLPIAEHALACPTHHLTGAQARAHATLGPALIWTGTPVLDVLTSNGVPVWHGERGTIHAAEVHTWRHIATGQYGPPGPTATTPPTCPSIPTRARASR